MKHLNYLINELEVGTYNIEKCPSIMYLNVEAIKENVIFLQTKGIKFYNVETCLHVLSTNPYDLKETYKYVLENYGIDSCRDNVPTYQFTFLKDKESGTYYFDKVELVK